MQVVHRLSITVVVQQFPGFLQLLYPILGEDKLSGELTGRDVEVVAEGPAYGPLAVFSADQCIDKQGRADIRSLVNTGCEQVRPGDVSGIMVVDILDPVALMKQPQEKLPVPVEGDVEDGDRAAMQVRDLGEKQGIPLGPGDPDGIGDGLCQSQLEEGAQAVGIAVEDVMMHE